MKHHKTVVPTFTLRLLNPSDYKAGERSQTPFGSNAVAFSSPEDLMKNMPKIISGMVGGGGATGTPTLKMSMRESPGYEYQGWR